MQKLDGPLKGLGRVPMCNLTFAKAQWEILYIKNPNTYISYFLIPNFFFHFVELLEFQSVGRTVKSGKDMPYWYMIYRLASGISQPFFYRAALSRKKFLYRGFWVTQAKMFIGVDFLSLASLRLIAVLSR